MERMSARCHLPSRDPIHTKPVGHTHCMKGGPPILAKASGDRQARVDRRLDTLHMDQKTHLGSNTRMGLTKLRRAGIPTRSENSGSEKLNM